MSTDDDHQQLYERYTKSRVQHYEESLAEFSRRLRRIADDVDREGKARVGFVNADGKPDYLYAVEQVIYTLNWGVANANLNGLLSSAADAHSAVRGRIK